MIDIPRNKTDKAAVTVIANHYRKDVKGCACGWSELGSLHALHVWREIQKAIRGEGTNGSQE